LNPIGTDKVRLVLNRTRKGDEIGERDVEKALRHAVTWRIGNDYMACTEAVNSGKTLLSIPGKRLTRDFREFAFQLAGFEPDERRKGLLRLLPSLG
jgi:Flp pilus assembly CpaE family ATPase